MSTGARLPRAEDFASSPESEFGSAATQASRLAFADRLRFKLALTLPRTSRRLRLERGILSVTFDDFPRSAWMEGGAIVEAHGARATYFPCGSLQGTSHDGIQQFTNDDLEALHAAGHEVGSHSFHHVSALRTSSRKFASSISLNERFLTERLPGSRRISFSYPFGDVSLSSIPTVMKSFVCARTVSRGVNGEVVSPYLLRGVGIERRSRNAFDIEALIETAARRHQWLICFTHDVSAHPSEFGCTPRDLDRVLRLARSAGMELSPLARVAACFEHQHAVKAMEAQVSLRPL